MAPNQDHLLQKLDSAKVISTHMWLQQLVTTQVYKLRGAGTFSSQHPRSLTIEDSPLHGPTLSQDMAGARAGSEAGESSEDGDAPFEEAFAQPLGVIAENGVQALGSTRMARVLQGFANLIKCTESPGGKFEVYKAGAIGAAVRLATTEDKRYVTQAMTLLEALTSPRGGVALGSERDDIYVEVSDHLEVLIKLMKSKRRPEARLLAAKTVVNILMNQPVWYAARSQYDIVSAFVAISNEYPADRNIMHETNPADRVCLLGLRLLTEFSNGGSNLDIDTSVDKTQIIVRFLMTLLREGLTDDGEDNLAKDSLVALDTQVLVMDYNMLPPEVCLLVRGHMSELMVSGAFGSHLSVPGRMAIVHIMTELCALYKEDIISDGLFLYLPQLITRTGDEVLSLLGSGEEQGGDLTKILSLSVKLLCFCVAHRKDAALQSVLTKIAQAQATLEGLLHEQVSGISNESRLEIMNLLEQMDGLSTDTPTTVIQLVKMMNSAAPVCRPQFARRILKSVLDGQRNEEDIAEMKKAGVIDALMMLLKEENKQCQQDALLALYALSPKIPIQTGQLPCQTILEFLSSKRPEVREAAVGLLDSMVKENAVNAKNFMKTPGALENSLTTLKNWLDKGAFKGPPESSSSQMNASVLLKMATEGGDDSVRRGILISDRLDILIKYVQKRQNDEFKELLMKMLGLILKTGTAPHQEAITKGGGHVFLLACLRENISKETAAEGLWSLIRNAKTQSDVVQAGFVTIAVESVNQRFASADIARGLANISSTPEGMDQVYASMKSVQALLVLLEHCPNLEGKGAAAAVIARLYHRLLNHTVEDSERLVELTAASSHLIKYLDLGDKSQLVWFLKALAAFATGKKGRQRIHEERGIFPLINSLKNSQGNNQVQDLMLKILTEMSCVPIEGDVDGDSTYQRISTIFLVENISELVSFLPKSAEFNNNTESMKNLLILIRNFSTAGPPAVFQLSEHHAVDFLLRVLKQRENETVVSVVTELAVKSLEKFVDEPRGKQAFIKGNGIQYLVPVLKLQIPTWGSDVKTFATIILTSVANDPATRKQACEAIFEFSDKGLFLSLNNIMFEGGKSRPKWQAAVLMKLLAMHGPTSKVCSAINTNGCLNALNDLRNVKHCKEVRDVADDVLNFVRKKSKECRKVIDGWKQSK